MWKAHFQGWYDVQVQSGVSTGCRARAWGPSVHTCDPWGNGRVWTRDGPHGRSL